jgi:hypothetical protein
MCWSLATSAQNFILNKPPPKIHSGKTTTQRVLQKCFLRMRTFVPLHQFSNCSCVTSERVSTNQNALHIPNDNYSI